MKSKFFAATQTGSFDGKRAGELQLFLRDYVMLVVPESNIEDWRVNDGVADARNLGPKSALPSVWETGDRRLHHFACYVRCGCESAVVEVDFVLQGGDHINLMSAKCWAPRETAWVVADAVERALSSIFAWEEIPLIVGMFRKLPRKSRYSVESTLEGTVSITTTNSSIELRTSDGSLLDAADFAGRPSPHLALEAYAIDWTRVLNAAGVRHSSDGENVGQLQAAA